MPRKDKNYYEVLDLRRDCKPEDIKKSFIKLSKEYHPDRNSSKNAHNKFVKINEAYTTLGNPTRRRLYDQQLSLGGSCDFNRNRVRRDESQYTYRNYDYSYYQYSQGKDRSNSYGGSKLLLRLTLLPKALLVTALVIVTLFSSGLEVYFLKNGFERRRRTMENQSIMASLILQRAALQAEISGKEEQMKRMKEGKLGVYDSDELVQAYIEAKESRRSKSK